VATSIRSKVLLVFEGEQGVQLFRTAQIDVTALSPVSTTGTTSGDVFLASECQAAVSAITGFDEDLRVINEHRETTRP